jgi:hypothetical protein
VSNRKLPDWLEAYMEYTEETESSPIFHRWVGMSSVAGALRKKVWLALGRLRVYPNLYIVLVAEPGIARKTQAINYGVDVISQIPAIITSADSITQQALVQDLELAACDEQMPDGRVFRHASMSIISKEFESFLGQKGENTKMIVFLTDLYDASDLPTKYRTKNSGNNTIPSVFVNMQAATTPDSLASCLPASAVGGGLTSRILFIWSTIKAKKVTRPELTPRIIQLKEYLIHDLSIISRIAGSYEFSSECFLLWDKWYKNYDETSKKRICSDPSFNGWYSRKPNTIQKIVQSIAASRSSNMTLEWGLFEEAFKLIEEVESCMGKTFSSIGKSDVAPEVDKVISIIDQHLWITEKQLLQMVWRDVDSTKFDNIMQTVIRSGYAERKYVGPKGEKGIWYHSLKQRVRED